MRGSVKGKERRARVVALYKKGWTLGSIARSMNVFTTQVSQVLEQEGLRKRLEMKPQDWGLERKVAEAYDAGQRPSDIAARFQISTWRVYRIAHELSSGVKKRGYQGRTFTRRQLSTMARMWRNGVTRADIAREFKSTQATIAKVLRESGLKLDSPWRQSNGGALPAGGRSLNGQGYWLVRVAPDDPMAVMRNGAGYVFEHRFVMAKALGRPLRLDETVHHIDGNRQNNAPENLQLRQGKHGHGTRHVCLDCGSCNVGPAPIGH